MSDEYVSAGCSGECGSCGSDCEGRDGASTITLSMENGETVECAILTIFQTDEREYIVLLPLDEEGLADGEEVYIYRYEKTESGAPFLDNIKDEEEYEKVSAGFEMYLQTIQQNEQFADIIEKDESAN